MGTILVGVVVVAAIGGAAYSIIKNKKSGNACSGCSGCSGAGESGCPSKQ